MDCSHDAVLIADIYVRSNKWKGMTPTTLVNGYSGTFDGNGHTIDIAGMFETGDNNPFCGLFRRVCGGGLVKNLSSTSNMT
jgi:hypothetical protein